MGPDTLAPLIPIAALMIPIVAIWTKHRQKIVEMQTKATAELSAEKAAQYAQHTRELEERVRVLERIVTDKGFDTAAQIEALRRDAPILEDRRP
ncbi:hypothetical protein Saro_1159 [Novosphingobium aromaticivorans DSM 12444]|uniref:Phage shock protein B n=1 Tax=Novosphingobium aromaticivorans (strain ATCC 700278 / DSM 12444 / CCUG 56034 / CIP 105152 / NBRC 16084 / F199) TaxID=279238 RepID=Q2G969_NOVAD|nr:hypothetical protein [Novosphingobium aromaticivorans]ABD25604.1 hypothetical protein Saro_1159 [Novosphingobium aromaticivorans DSM 12444]SCX98334.1 hypothetical protein SAMN05660666_00492 [Novosphingobium aromaticivorans]